MAQKCSVFREEFSKESHILEERQKKLQWEMFITSWGVALCLWLSIAINCCPLKGHQASCTACQAYSLPWECSGLTHFEDCVHSRIPYKRRRHISALKGACSQGVPLSQVVLVEWPISPAHCRCTGDLVMWNFTLPTQVIEDLISPDIPGIPVNLVMSSV